MFKLILIFLVLPLLTDSTVCPEFCHCSEQGTIVHCDNPSWIYLPRDLNSNVVENLKKVQFMKFIEPIRSNASTRRKINKTFFNHRLLQQFTLFISGRFSTFVIVL